MITIHSLDEVKALVYGGAFYGGGGGGWIDEGLKLAKLVLELAGEIRIVRPEEVAGNDIVVTASAVGAPGAGERPKPVHMVRAAKLLIDSGISVSGFIPSEVGAYNGLNGVLQSAILGLSFIDSPCDGRAHPTGLMGSMGLHRVKGYTSVQAVVGGDKARGTYVEVVVRANLEKASRIVRSLAVEAGGVVSVARNPVPAWYARRYGAPGALAKAYEVGKTLYRNIGAGEPLEAAYKALEDAKGEALGECLIGRSLMETTGGFDKGVVELECSGRSYRAWFLNEYIALETLEGRRIATFPDLILVLDAEKGLPLSSPEAVAARGRRVLLGYVNRYELLLGYGLRYPEAYKPLEEILGLKILKYVEDIIAREEPEPPY